MAYPGQRWQQQHPPQQQNYNSNRYGNGGYQQQQQPPWQSPPPNNWQPHQPNHGPYAGQGPMYGGNDPNYPGYQYNQQGYIGAGPNPPYGEPRPYPPSQYGGPPMQPPQHYGQPINAPPPPQYNFAPVHQQPQYEANQPFYYKYSECTGKRKALLIGINYTGTSAALRGCHNDVRNMSRFLTERYNYKSEDMVILMDDPSFGWRQQPTRQNILEAMRWLVSGAQPNDSLFFHYSGHGGQAKDVSGDEDDGSDETIYPLDHKQAGMIIDDEMHAVMVKPLPAGCRLTAIYDSCHSGTALDLPYVYDTSGKIKEPNLFKDAGMGAVGAVTSYLKGDLGGVFSSLSGVGKKIMNTNSGAADRAKQMNTSPADVISWSGCKDIQTSADATEAGKATGAMSWGFVTALTKYPQQSYIQLLNTIRDELAAKYSQKPQLSSSHPIDDGDRPHYIVTGLTGISYVTSWLFDDNPKPHIMAPKLKTSKSKAAAERTSSPQHPVEIAGDSSDDDGKKMVATDEHEEQQAMSEAGSYDGDFFDPALLDEEETPNADGKPAGNGKASASWGGPGGYNALKTHNGQYYSGMAIGGSHTWNYQPGVWKETKKEPDLWEIDYKTNKVRNHKAPVNSGAPVGTEYHWYIIAHQHVKKIDANTYETHLTGSKYKLAHKNVNSKNWDIPTVKGQRDREIFLLEDAKRRIEGLPPVLSNEKIKIDKKEKGQATLGNFFQASPAKKRKERSEEKTENSPKKASKV